MADTKHKIDEILKDLKTQRDELALEMYLAKAEAKDEWERLEKKLAELKRQSGPAREIAAETVKNVGSAMELAGEEIKKGYERIRAMLRS